MPSSGSFFEALAGDLIRISIEQIFDMASSHRTTIQYLMSLISASFSPALNI
jgi:hypothetical protein